MRRVLLFLVGLVVVVVAAGAVVFFTGSTLPVLGFVFQPRDGWDMSKKAAAPDYANPVNWAALPANPGLTAYVPQGVAAATRDSGVDVFFVHPTGEMDGGDWNSPMNPNSQTEENTHWMMANQASVFNGCCAIYAPRYREATIITYISATPDIRKKTMDLAYGDVDRAFTYFLEHYSRGRPFIIASHSQGTFHAFRLLRERIDGTPLAQRLVAAYLIGGDIRDHEADAMKTIHVCNSATDIHCVIHWATWGENPKPRYEDRGKLVCVNPLNWMRDGRLAPASAHRGGVPASGRFQIRLWISEVPASGVVFAPLAAPVPNWTWAECRGGLLTVADQDAGPFSHMDLGGRNYHGLDYPLFAMDLRDNAIARVTAYKAANP
ncbi:MAG: DUF3089 domain-containing protein [Rhizomicrobium sp.]|jgi:hypothetical protein